MGRQDVCEHRVLLLRFYRVLCGVVLVAAWRRSPHVGTRQVAEYVARTLWATTSPSKSESKFPTHLTQEHRRIAKGQASFPSVKVPKPERLCRGCGKKIQGDSLNCKKCDIAIATKRLVEVARAGRIAGHTPDAVAKEAATHRKHAQARAAWNPAKQPAWLTEEVFSEKIQPALVRVSATLIAKRIGVSRQYAACIREGYRPHSRQNACNRETYLACARISTRQAGAGHAYGPRPGRVFVQGLVCIIQRDRRQNAAIHDILAWLPAASRFSVDSETVSVGISRRRNRWRLPWRTSRPQTDSRNA